MKLIKFLKRKYREYKLHQEWLDSIWHYGIQHEIYITNRRHQKIRKGYTRSGILISDRELCLQMKIDEELMLKMIFGVEWQLVMGKEGPDLEVIKPKQPEPTIEERVEAEHRYNVRTHIGMDDDFHPTNEEE